MTQDSPPATIRLDKWLWFARLAKSRALAAKLCAEGAVTLGGAPAGKASRPVHVGDVITVPRGRLLHRIRVVALGTRRGPAAEARLLYIEEAPPQPLGEDRVAWTPLLADDDAD